MLNSVNEKRHLVAGIDPRCQFLFRGLVACLVLFFVHQGSAYAQERPTDEQEILPPPPVLVLQNRFFKKALRPEVSFFGGTILNEAYSKTTMVGGRFGLFFNEWVGLDYSFTDFQVEDSTDLKALRAIEVYEKGTTNRTLVEPSFVTLKQQHSFTATLAPIYGKVNLFDFLILYSDIYFSAGFGILETSQGSKNPLILGVGQRFYFAKRFNIRIDAWDNIFEQVRNNLGIETKSTKHEWTVAFGASVFLW